MPTLKSLLFASILSILVCGSVTHPSDTFAKTLMVTGKVIDANGAAPIRADVHLGSFSGDPDKSLNFACAPDGSFSVPISAPGVYAFRASAVNHEEVTIPLDIEPSVMESGMLTLTIQLHPDVYDLSGDRPIPIFGPWNESGQARTDTLTLTKTKDGKAIYTFETKATADTFAYELGGIAGSHTVNGTQADYFVYDGGGDYRSVLRTKRGRKIKVTFDPTQLEPLMKGTYSDLPRVTVQGDVYLSRTISLALLADAMHNAALTIPPDGGPIRMSAAKMHAVLDTLQTAFIAARSSGDTLLTQFVAALIARQYHPELHFGAPRAREVLGALPTSSPLWSLAENYVMDLVSLADTLSRKAFVEGLSTNPDRGVRANAMVQQMEEAKAAYDTTRWKAIYNTLHTDYSDLREIAGSLLEFNPDAQVKVGRHVPPFELTSFDDGKPISDKTMLGRYYMIDFWATWCGPCVDEMPSIHNAYARFKGRKGFEIVSISMDASKTAIPQFRKKWKMPWLNAFIPGVFDSPLAKNFEVAGIPRPILVDPQGNIVAMEDSLRGAHLENTLLKFLGEEE